MSARRAAVALAALWLVVAPNTPILAQTAVVGTKSINQLPAAGTITGNEIIPLMQNGATKQTTLSGLSSLSPLFVTNQSVLAALGGAPLPLVGGTLTGNTKIFAPSFTLDTSIANVRTPNIIGASAFGNAISYCSIDGCVYLDGAAAGLPAALDHQRAGLLASTITSDDGHSQENTLGLETTIATGWKTGWAASTAYAPLANIITTGNNIYRAEGACTSGSTAPSGFGTGIADGTCAWDWINGANLDAKVGFYNAVRVKQGAGPSWGSAENVVIEAGSQQPGVTQKEMDLTNLGPAAVIGSPIMLGLNIGLGGNTVTAGQEVGSAGGTALNPGALFGSWYTGFLSKYGDVEIDSSSVNGVGFNVWGGGGARSNDIFSNSKSTKVLYDTGVHAGGSIDLEGTSPAALLIGPGYTSQIVGQNFSVNGGGNLGAVTVSISPTATGSVAGAVNKLNLFGTLNGTAYGLGVSASSQDYAVPSGAVHSFYVGGAKVGSIGSTFSEVLTTPATSTATCTTGQFTDDANYHYVCVATNTWKRAALSAF